MVGAASPVEEGMPPTAPQGLKPRPRRKVAKAEANVGVAATALAAKSTLRQSIETSKAGSADVENLYYTAKAPDVVDGAKSTRKRIHSDSESLTRAGTDVNEDVSPTSIDAPPAKKTKKLATMSAKRDNAVTTNTPDQRTSTRGQEARASQLTGMANASGTTIITDPVGSMSVEDVADDDEAEHSDHDDEPSALTQEQEPGQDDEAQSDSGEESECDDTHKLAAHLVAESVAGCVKTSFRRSRAFVPTTALPVEFSDTFIPLTLSSPLSAPRHSPTGSSPNVDPSLRA
ncbi:hypothetical protein DICSQDRAFT_174769 [Dichomitus squalens LYAD-421 SS1]|uniref:Uncharacterized protein n=1 Tax=Dichomitus squalens (strain LYAD-421) TaxID=732165 RepID=R7SK62_DICSQ|nr:uncharacterized protein DICSQDRAFT_174769 [Dichomitus squalens LYAD-421 SS1]EJF56541.1 hypothetical protein DICSQDRAFT_174769 [Dichomitus squalens LYAD-421 SS1]